MLVEQSIRDRLFNQGTFPDGSKIKTYSAESGVYSNFTIDKKREEGAPYDRVTLFDEGNLYESFDMQATAKDLKVKYKDKKKVGKVSDNVDTFEAIALGDEGVIKLQDAILPEMRNDVLTEIKTILKL